MDEFKVFLAVRDRVLRELDTEAFIKATGCPQSIALMAMHKARYEVTSMPDDLRHASRDWLEKQGYSRYGGLSWPPAGVLER